jgi:serine phosphatase RsbU (regulator of sigma subunit)
LADTRDEETTLFSRTGLRPAPGPAAERAHYLVVIEGSSKGLRIPISAAPVTLGRSAPADVVLADPRISRRHCTITLSQGKITVTDLESSNGTFVDGERVKGFLVLAVGAHLQVGSHVLEHEWRNRKEVEESQELDRDLERASQYIQALLPPPLAEGPIRSDWVLVPCARLGGDAFGYRFLDSNHFVMYLIDVSGHGTGAAMHAVSIMNVLRQSALPDTDFLDPSSVLAKLNAAFRMSAHGDMYLTLWYGVYDVQTRRLVYASAGHHAAYLVEKDRDSAIPLKTKNPVIGAAEGISFVSDSTIVSPGSMLYVFSDGVYEIITKEGRDWQLEDFVAFLLLPPQPGMDESQRLLKIVRDRAKNAALDDDFTLMAFTFMPPPRHRALDATWPDLGAQGT